MEGLPITLKLAGRRCLMVGGGTIAARKIGILLRAGAEIVVVAPRLSTQLRDLVDAGRIAHVPRRFMPNDLAGAALAVIATADRALNAEAAAEAERRGIPVNVVDDPDLCTVIIPAIVDRGPVSVAVSTGGASPTLARHVRAEIERALPARIGDLARFAAHHRATVRAAIPEAGARRRFWDAVVEGPVAGLVYAGRTREATIQLRRQLSGQPQPRLGRVILMGAGPGDPELLTLKAWRLLQKADVIVHDALVSDAVLNLARREAERIFAGKRRGAHCMKQAEINALLVRLAREGKTVVRLKGGDPLVFGRGGEEHAALAAKSIPCEIVPGITAALGCAAATGIPLTHRDHAQTCLFVTAHRRDGHLDLDWPALARPKQTLCIYMGLSVLAELTRQLAAAGLPRSTAAALIENGTRPDQRVTIATVGDIAEHARGAATRGPVLLIVGTVVDAKSGAASAISETLRAARPDIESAACVYRLIHPRVDVMKTTEDGR